MKISLVLPFRERTKLLSEMFESLIDTAADINNVEVLIVIDDNEPRRDTFLDIVNKARESLSVEVVTVPRSEHFTKDYINPLARRARGRWVIAINDDCDFKTIGWDVEIDRAMTAHIDKTRDEIFIGLLGDELPRPDREKKYPKFSCWTVVPKAVIDALGYLWDERCYVWGPDHIIAKVFRQLADERRLVSLTHVTIGHKSTHTGRRDVHENQSRFAEIEKKREIYHFEIDDTVKMLRGFCKS